MSELQKLENNENFDGEVNFTKKVRSGWDTAENVGKLIEKFAPMLEDLLKTHAQTSKDATQVINKGVLLLIMMIVLGAFIAVIIDVANGRIALAEKVIIPLISFAGGLGLNATLKR